MVGCLLMHGTKRQGFVPLTTKIIMFVGSDSDTLCRIYGQPAKKMVLVQ